MSQEPGPEATGTSDELGATRALLSGWTVAEPPAGFADRVLAARVGAQPQHTSHARRRGVYAVAVCVALAAAAWLASTRLAETSGAVIAAARTVVEVGDRAVAVAEQGASLRWRVRGREEATVRQDAGSAFYRVDHGGPFVVETPAGNVRVLGTCFRVEVTTMDKQAARRLMGAGAVGAAIATLTTVTVYEGKVALANAFGETTIAPGEWARASAGERPSPAREAGAGGSASAASAASSALAGVPDDPSLRYAPHRVAALESLVERQEARIRELEASGGEPTHEGAADGPARFYPTSQEEFEALAARCAVRADTYEFADAEVPSLERIAKSFDLAPGEAEAIQQAFRRVNDRYVRDVRALYLEATGEEEAARFLTPWAMIQDMQAKAGSDEMRDPTESLAKERAGLAQPPPNLAALAPQDRAFRRMANIGNEFQAELAKVLGPERAHELRAQKGGWPGGQSEWRSRCTEK